MYYYHFLFPVRVRTPARGHPMPLPQTECTHTCCRPQHCRCERSSACVLLSPPRSPCQFCPAFPRALMIFGSRVVRGFSDEPKRAAFAHDIYLAAHVQVFYRISKHQTYTMHENVGGTNGTESVNVKHYGGKVYGQIRTNKGRADAGERFRLHQVHQWIVQRLHAEAEIMLMNPSAMLL